MVKRGCRHRIKEEEEKVEREINTEYVWDSSWRHDTQHTQEPLAILQSMCDYSIKHDTSIIEDLKTWACSLQMLHFCLPYNDFPSTLRQTNLILFCSRCVL